MRKGDATGRHGNSQSRMPCGITQSGDCYPGRADSPALTPAEYSSGFSDPGGLQAELT